MADRTSAAIFGKVFELIAVNITDETKNIAEELYKETYSYDFSQYQMKADEALIKLGFAKKFPCVMDKEFPEIKYKDKNLKDYV